LIKDEDEDKDKDKDKDKDGDVTCISLFQVWVANPPVRKPHLLA